MRTRPTIRRGLVPCFLAAVVVGMFMVIWTPSYLGGTSGGNLLRTFIHGNHPTTDNPIYVFIYSKYRTGSTFTSEVFLRHKAVSYVFEPLNLRKSNLRKQLAVLWDHFTCNLVVSKNLYHVHRRWLHQDSFCRMPHQTPGCKPGGWGTTLEMEEFLPKAQKHCQQSTVRVIKEIRIHDIREIISLPLNNVKLVHLIRDPRGVVNSRDTLKRYKDEDISDVAEHYCSGIIRDLQSILLISNTHPNIVSQLYVVRYEDLASQNIMHELDDLYTFIGVDPDASLREWAEQVAVNSSVKSAGPNRVRVKNYYGVARPNPEATARGWRKALSFERTEIIQDACDMFLEIFRYNKFATAEEYADDDLPVTLRFDRDGLFHRLVEVTMLHSANQ